MDSSVSFGAESIASSVSFRHKAFESSQWFDGGGDDDDDELYTFIRCIGERRAECGRIGSYCKALRKAELGVAV